MSTLIRHRSGTYYLVFSRSGKRVWRSLHTRDRKTAYQIFLKQGQHSEEREELTLLEAQRLVLPFVETNFSKGALAVYKNIFSQFNKQVSDRLISTITPREIDFYKISRIREVSPATVNLELRGLRAFFNRLIVWKYLEQNPCQGIRDIREVEKLPLFLTKEDLAKLLAHTKGDQLHDLILLAAMTGLRKGELLNLTWNDVDLKRGILIVRSSVSYRTKAGKIRSVPLNATAHQLLESITRTSDLIFPGDRGGPYNHDFLSRRFKRAVLKCGLDKRLHFHSLRHTFASLLVQDGVPLYNVQRLLGHSSARVTEIYAHLGHAELSGSVERLTLAG